MVGRRCISFWGKRPILIQALALLASGIYLQGVFFFQNLNFVSMFVGGSLTIKPPHKGEFPTSGNWSLWFVQTSGVFCAFFSPSKLADLKKIHTQTCRPSLGIPIARWIFRCLLHREKHVEDETPILFEKDHQLLKGIQKQFGEHNKKTVRIIGIALGFYTRVPLTPVFEGQPPKTRVIWVLDVYIYIYSNGNRNTA